ncbi:wobble nucleotide-excising tRNase [Rhizobium sp. PP-F2F-G38]|nr:wobble nucleotide-excising tRNase [Rhizobium sp. PP-F2F-G38]
MFELSQGGTRIGRLSLDLTTRQATPLIGDRIFHVFSEDFVHSELRQTNFVVNGNIESKITLDHTIIRNKDAEDKVQQAETRLSESIAALERELGKAKEEQLSTKAGVNRRLREYMAIQLSELISGHSALPAQPARNFGNVLGDLDALKSVPIEPDYPGDIESITFNASVIDTAIANLSRMTSPSSVAEEIKAKIMAHHAFIETGIELVQNGEGRCPFCEQSVEHPPAKDLIASYIAFFSDAEGAHKKALREDWSRVKSLRAAVAACETSYSRNLSRYDSLKKLVPSQKNVTLPDLSKGALATDTMLGAYSDAIERKGTSPGEEVKRPEVDLPFSFATLRQTIAEINQAFLALREAIGASDTERRNLHREACEKFAVEFVKSNWSSFEAVRARQDEARFAAAELAELKKSQLSDDAKDRVATTFKSLIVSFFGQKYSFDKASFTLRRDNREMTRGPSRTLSDGEKTVIAFCYFIACVHKKVKTTSDYGKVFLVFDDPITSMSYDYVFAIAQTLKHLSISTTGTVSINPADINKGFLRPELLVFTHSSYFYNICVTNKVVKDESAFFLHKAGQTHQLSKLKKYIAPFEEHLREIVGVQGGAEPSHTTGHAIRCVLEAIGRFCHPDKCDSLSNYISYLAGDEGFEIKSVLINNLSHGTYYDETPSPDEIKDACEEAIRIVERYAKGQLEIARALHGGA